MLQLSHLTVRILEASTYVKDCGSEHRTCDVCLDDLHAGQLAYTNGSEWVHTRCALPGVRVHELHQLVSGGAR